MTSPIYPVFEGDGGSHGPAWPTENDFGGLLFEDDPTAPPLDRKRLSATDYMQLEMSLARACRMIPALTIGWTPGGANYTPNHPVISWVDSVNDKLTTSTVHVTRSTTGIYIVYWDDSIVLPLMRQLPQTFTAAGGASYAAITGQSGNQITVSVYSSLGGTGTLTDNPAYAQVLKVFGQ